MSEEDTKERAGSPRSKKSLEHLEALVGFNTQNPPRAIDDDGLFAYLRDQLDGFDVDLWDLGDGCLGLHAVRGEPDLLFNFHVDTVPASDDWSSDPFDLRVADGRAVGLGACDIKGASACMLAAVERLDASTDLALLFTSDEEAGSSRCVRHFLTESHGYDGVIVAEPTGAKAVAEHRGIMTATGHFSGRAGHASDPRALEDNALHRLTRWADAALAYAEDQQEEQFRNLNGIRFNIGRIEGGVKPNVIAPEATVRFGFRPRPDQRMEKVFDEICGLANGARAASPPESENTNSGAGKAARAPVDWEEGFVAPPLPADPDDRGAGRRLADNLGLPVAQPVDFWTEAALFSEAGYPTVVFGPGDIAQAHTADEWVALDQLAAVTDAYLDILEVDR
jgi:acetylornithine deacetylase